MKKRRTLWLLPFLFCLVSISLAWAATYTISINSTGSGTVSPSGNQSVSEGDDLEVTATADENSCIATFTVTKGSDPEGDSVGAASGHSTYSYPFANIKANYKVDVAFAKGKIKVVPKAYNQATESAEPIDAPWKVCVTDSYGDVPDKNKCVSGNGEKTVDVPSAQLPCDSSILKVEFERYGNGNYYTPSSETVHVSTAVLTGEITVEGIYEPNSYHLGATVVGSGQISINPKGVNLSGSASDIQTATYAVKTSVILSASADAGHFFQKWKGDIGANDINATAEPSITVTMDKDRSLSAIFVGACADADGDGFTTGNYGTSCTPSAQIDCDDSDASIYPGAAEVCGDGLDQDCDGADVACGENVQDNDGDGFSPHQGDCDDSNASIAPSMYDAPTNKIDEDCYGNSKLPGEEVINVLISDVPVAIKKKPAPPLMMFLIDDSGSMDWEYIVKGASTFIPAPSTIGIHYILPSTSAQSHSETTGRILPETTAAANWKAKWSDHNTIYFNGQSSYLPWPKWKEVYEYKAQPSEVVLLQRELPINERVYDPSKNTFPDKAFEADYTHADMDLPRSNNSTKTTLYKPGVIVNSSMYHPSDGPLVNNSLNNRYELPLNELNMVLNLKGQGTSFSSVTITTKTTDNTAADAIGLSTNPTLTNSTASSNKKSNWFNTRKEDPEYIFDDQHATLFTTTGTWTRLLDPGYSWKNRSVYSRTANATATWTIPMPADAPDQKYYVYAWVEDGVGASAIAHYTINYYDEDGKPASETVYDVKQGDNGGRWIRIGTKSYRFRTGTSPQKLHVPHAHYFTLDDINGDGVQNSGEDVYLVTMPGTGRKSGDYSLNFYKATAFSSSGEVVTGVEPVPFGRVPAAVKPRRYYASSSCSGTTMCEITDAKELAYVLRQDFANWYSFYRRRMLTAKAAVGLTVVDMEGASMGIMAINKTNEQIPLTYIEKKDNDKKMEFLCKIYNYRAVGGTPLRAPLYAAGKYFERGNGGDTSLSTAVDPTLVDLGNRQCQEGAGTSSPSVFWSEECGGSCQRAYIILLTDGYYNGSPPLSLGNVDGGSGYDLIFRDVQSNKLADYAMLFYDIDLDPILPDSVPTKLYDDNNRQHITLFTVSFGVGGNYDTWRFPDCLPSVTSCMVPGQNAECPTVSSLKVLSFADYKTAVAADSKAVFRGYCPQWWGAGTSGTYSTIDDLWHAAINTRGQYLNAANPDDLIKSLATIKSLVVSQVGTVAAVTVNAQKIETDSLLFQTMYDSSGWTGDVVAKCLDSQGEVISCARRNYLTQCKASYDTAIASCTDEETRATCINSVQNALTTCQNNAPLPLPDAEIEWRASAKRPDHTERQIITATKAGKGIPFTWDGLDAVPAMRLALTSSSTANALTEVLKAEAKLVLNYIRGDVSNEGESKPYFRKRSGKFGDFINSAALYYNNTKLGVQWVIVGGNDGMLHIFDANTGVEKFAFIPYSVFSKLRLLTEQEYGENAHQYFVDGNAQIQELDNGTVILVGGLGKGGKAYYALNLSAAAAIINDNYESAAADIVLWEYFPETDSVPAGQASHLDFVGYSYSKPQIVTTKASDAERLVVVGNGYDSKNKKAALLILALKADGKLAYTHVLDTGVGTNTGGTSDVGVWNGLSMPALIYPFGDGANDFVYAGDLLGNMWKFDLSFNNKNQWNIYFKDSSGTPQPLFQAKNIMGWRQPIVMQPMVSSACATGQKGYMVYFGTGRLQGDFDFADHSYQSVYGIWDWSAAWGSSNPRQKYLGEFGGYINSSGCNSACSTEQTSCKDACPEVDTSCRNVCVETFNACKDNCSSARSLSNMGNAIGNSSAATLLRQTQVWGGGIDYTDDGEILRQVYGVQPFEAYDNIVRTMTARPIDWQTPHGSTPDGKIRHLGWHHDLPINGERVIVNMELVNYRLVYASMTPSTSPCEEEGGDSYYWAVDSCTGGRLDEAFFDANMDGKVDSKDYINIGTATNPIFVAVSGIGVAGMAPAPTIIQVEGGYDKLYYTDGSSATNSGVPSIVGGDSPDNNKGGGVSINTGSNTIMYWIDKKWKQ